MAGDSDGLRQRRLETATAGDSDGWRQDGCRQRRSVDTRLLTSIDFSLQAAIILSQPSTPLAQSTIAVTSERQRQTVGNNILSKSHPIRCNCPLESWANLLLMLHPMQLCDITLPSSTLRYHTAGIYAAISHCRHRRCDNTLPSTFNCHTVCLCRTDVTAIVL